VPTYSYACTECDHRFEVQQAFSDSSLTTCPQCSGRLRKLFNAVGIVFKGSGFYRTDSRSGGSCPNTSQSSNSSSRSTCGAGEGAGATSATAGAASSSDSSGSTSTPAMAGAPKSSAA
jgi:putative FmdB family regulatory protein